MEESNVASDTDVKSNVKFEEKGVPEKNENRYESRNDLTINNTRDESRSPMENDPEDSNFQMGSQKSGKMPGWRNEECMEPNYYSDSSSASRRTLRNFNNQDGGNTVQCLNQDKAELLRKLDEIKERLIWNSNAVDESKESGPGKYVPGPSDFHHYAEPFHYTGGNQMPMHGLYPFTSNPTRITGYGEPFGLQMHTRPPNVFPGQYLSQPIRPYFPGRYVDIGPDLLDSQLQDPIFRPYFPVPPNRFDDVPYSPASYHHEKIRPFSPHNYNDRRTNIPSPLISSGPQTHRRWQSDVDSDIGGGFAHGYAPNMVSASGVRRFRPLAGGAPFIACHNCFELLQLPKRVLKKQEKLQCGACSEPIGFAIINKKLVLSSGFVETNPVSREVDDGSSSEVVKGTTTSHAHVDRSSGNFSSVDYDNSGYDFHAMDKEPVEASRKPRDMQSFHFSSSSDHPEYGDDYDSPNTDRKVVKSVPPPVKDAKVTPPPPGSSLQELFEYSTVNRAALSNGMANLSLQSDKKYMMQNSMNEGSVVTETDVSYNGYSNTEVSEDSGDRTKEDDQRRSKDGGDSTVASILKESFRNQNEEGETCGVMVNRHPIPEDLVKNAEKMAGPIQPGNYWYDYRAGFWGVMGKPCLGITLPFIDEFNYPMPEKCAGGNTGVFVNGRELHQRDLDLLAKRGLPTHKNRSYIIDISGRVLDGDTGEELGSLGKLAPSVEKAKHGFGMRVPRVAS